MLPKSFSSSMETFLTINAIIDAAINDITTVYGALLFFAQ